MSDRIYEAMCDLRLPRVNRRELPSFGLLRSEECVIFLHTSDVSGQPIGPGIQGTRILNPKNGTDEVYRNVGKKLP